MRIISGKARGRRIDAPEGLNTRPVTDQIRESLFNMWQMDIYDSEFLDLFSGSGSMGLEAMSRGASKVVMVDNSIEATRIIKQNIVNTGLGDVKHQVCKGDVFREITRLDNNNEQFDIIYVDPPFTVDEIFYPLMEALGQVNILKENGVLAIRTLKVKKMGDIYGCLSKTKDKMYGISCVHFYELT